MSVCAECGRGGERTILIHCGDETLCLDHARAKAIHEKEHDGPFDDCRVGICGKVYAYYNAEV